jgi:hypothetical protein
MANIVPDRPEKGNTPDEQSSSPSGKPSGWRTPPAAQIPGFGGAQQIGDPPICVVAPEPSTLTQPSCPGSYLPFLLHAREAAAASF